MVQGVPEPARRYFLFAIAPGTPLRTVAKIEMSGEIGLGSKSDPGYMPMRAGQVLAPLQGFVWRPVMGGGRTRISGSDGYFAGEGWTRFWLARSLPVARAGGTPDYARSAAARGIAEGIFWVPAALLPRRGVKWEAVDESTARVVVQHRGEQFSADLTVAPNGRPLSVSMQRWSKENPERVWRCQPFGGTIEEVRRFGGYTVGTRINGGNHFGTPEYFPFFRAHVDRIEFL